MAQPSKSVSGYAITIRAFVPVDPKNLSRHGEIIAAVRAATEEGKAGDLLAMAQVDEIDAKSITRRIKPGSGTVTPPAGQPTATANASHI